MNEYEIMVKDMETAIGKALGITYEGERLPFSLHTRNCLAKDLVNAGYRKVADDEIVESMKTYERARQETAREILQELFDYFKKDVDTLWIKVVELAKNYDIELE